MFDEDMIVGDCLVPGPRGAKPRVEMPLRLPWYRSLPLSCVAGLEVEFDDEPVAGESLAVRINGHEHAVAELPGLHDVWWFVLDSVDLVVGTAGETPPGGHRVDLTFRLRIPYGDPTFRPREFVQVARCTRELELLEREV